MLVRLSLLKSACPEIPLRAVVYFHTVQSDEAAFINGYIPHLRG